MDNDPPLALSNEAAQPVRDPQPESSVDAALGDAFTSQGRSNTIRFLGEFESAFASYLASGKVRVLLAKRGTWLCPIFINEMCLFVSVNFRSS